MKTENQHPLDAAILAAIKELARFQPTKIRHYADKSDAENISLDLFALCEIIDPLVEAIGTHAAAHLPIKTKAFNECFVGQLRGALEGNATYIVTAAGEELDEERREDAADARRVDLRLLDRAHS